MRPSLLALFALALAAPACGDKAPPAADAAPVAKPARMEGQVRFADAWLEVAPLVLHDAKMDLRTRCRVAQDEAKETSRPVPPLCFGPDARPREAITTIRVERWPSMPAAIRSLTATAEGTHFLVERTGSFHQTLDLAYPVRREGQLQPGEVRVLAADPSHGKALVDALVTLFPAARVETVDGKPVAPTEESGPGKPVIAPSKPPSDPHGHGPGDGHDHE